MPNSPRRARGRRLTALVATALACSIATTATPAMALAPDGVGLGVADNFAVLGGQGVTNVGPTTVSGDLGTSPNPAVTGAGLVVNSGTVHAADAVAAQAQADLIVAYDDASGRPAAEIATELGGQVLTAGAYDSASGTFHITGTLTLDAEGNPDAVFVLQTSSTLVTATASSVAIVNGGSACNVFWQVGSSATLGTFSTFRGTVMALSSITVTTGVVVDGRTLARNGSVTLDNDTITRATCTTPKTTGTVLTSSPNPSDVGPVTITATVTAPAGGTPTGTVTFLDAGVPVGSATVVAGTANLIVPLALGNHDLTAVYVGGPGFTPSTSPIVTHSVVTRGVAPIPTTTTSTTSSTTSTTVAATGPTTTAAPRASGPVATTIPAAASDGATGGTTTTARSTGTAGPTASAASSTGGATSRALARTGTGSIQPAAVALLLITAGGALALLGSRATRKSVALDR